jgi:hypothetical protein
MVGMVSGRVDVVSMVDRPSMVGYRAGDMVMYIEDRTIDTRLTQELITLQWCSIGHEDNVGAYM